MMTSSPASLLNRHIHPIPLLSTLLSVGANAGIGYNEGFLLQGLGLGASQSFSQTGQQIVQRQLNIQPTLTIRPGFPVRVIVTRDIVFR